MHCCIYGLSVDSNHMIQQGVIVKDQQSYSHGLLYSVAPDNFSALHLNEDEGKNEFDWEAYEAQHGGGSLVGVILGFLKSTAVAWGLIKLH